MKNYWLKKNTGFPDDDYFFWQSRGYDIYSSKFVQNEESVPLKDHVWNYQIHYQPLEHSPVLAGSLTGKIYKENKIIQCFMVGSAGHFIFTHIGNYDKHAVRGILNIITGQLSLTWDSWPGEHKLVINYEYKDEE